jgi:hypothetical protein
MTVPVFATKWRSARRALAAWWREGTSLDATERTLSAMTDTAADSTGDGPVTRKVQSETIRGDPLLHLQPVLTAELERGNRLATTTVGPADQGTVTVLKYAIDDAAIRAQVDFDAGHSLFRTDRGDWVVRCEHTNAALLGLSVRRTWASRRACRRWWRRWDAGPQERTSI